jgi:tryptophanyl-tRNA synthetase
MDLQHPTRKMSKSDETNKGCIYILDDINVSKKKIKSAVTDSDSHVHFDPENKPGISNLLEIYSTLTNRPIPEIEEQYVGKGYGEFKNDLAEIVGEELEKIQTRYKEITTGSYLDDILEEGAKKARIIARKKLAKVERKIGITIKK